MGEGLEERGERFAALARERFAFLESEYGLEELGFRDYGFRSEATLSYSTRDRALTVGIVKHHECSEAIWVDLLTRGRRLDLEQLAEALGEPFLRLVVDRERTTRAGFAERLDYLARLLRTYGGELLRGDVSVLESVNRFEERSERFAKQVYLALLRRGLDEPGPPDADEAAGLQWSMPAGQIESRLREVTAESGRAPTREQVHAVVDAAVRDWSRLRDRLRRGFGRHVAGAADEIYELWARRLVGD